MKKITIVLSVLVLVGIVVAGIVLFRMEKSAFLEGRPGILPRKISSFLLGDIKDRSDPEDGVIPSAKLEFRFVHPENDREALKYKQYLAEGYDPDSYWDTPSEGEFFSEVYYDDDNNPVTDYLLVETDVQMNGDDIRDSYVTRDKFGQLEIMILFNEQGSLEFARITGANVGRRLAIVLDGTLYSAPVLRTKIDTGTAIITGSFSLDEARRISAALRKSGHAKKD